MKKKFIIFTLIILIITILLILAGLSFHHKNEEDIPIQETETVEEPETIIDNNEEISSETENEEENEPEKEENKSENKNDNKNDNNTETKPQPKPDNNQTNTTTKTPNNNYTNDNGIFSSYYEEAEKILKTLSTEEKIAQLFIIPYSSKITENNYQTVGGFIFFGGDVKGISKTTLKNKINTIQNKSKVKFLITIDEEGGTVSRLNTNGNLSSIRFESPRTYYSQGGLDKILEIEEYRDNLLKELGFNLNLAPVADISTNSTDFMYKRSIGLNPTDTGTYIYSVTKKAKELNFSTCLKHFPGYGPNGDSHVKQTVDNRTLEYLKNNDLIPFQKGIEAGTPFILVSHNIITSVDSKYPASLSKEVINILKNDLNYSGIIITDDLAMDAVDSFDTKNEAAVLAIQAGNDMVILTTKYKEHYNAVVSAVNKGTISEERINNSVIKILAWKLAYNII